MVPSAGWSNLRKPIIMVASALANGFLERLSIEEN
jgi:hypothetical protein